MNVFVFKMSRRKDGASLGVMVKKESLLFLP